MLDRLLTYNFKFVAILYDFACYSELNLSVSTLTHQIFAIGIFVKQ